MFPARHAKTREILQLYRKILVEHRKKLEWNLRDVGDRYARQEFRRLRDFAAAVDSEKTYDTAVTEFLAEWRRYLHHVCHSKTVGRELDAATLSLLSDDQKASLEKIRSLR